ncbi:unnamed protein product [Brassicogethes aeneus]|uniref:Uncharacterized protein n=1 Tax=Brassicogethes aeneus TaxID=1431903 RepID=A0A9P0BIE5_BRAAE|nr:unnamed protein product [Brassicogethes aeneus]
MTASQRVPIKDKRQVSTVTDQQDNDPAATGFNEAIHAGSKHFQYIHVPQKDHYEHGHKRGNEHHFIERHEKAHPHAGEFKTKVRWGDKHGGYGEHYYDYNHAGHGHDGEGDESQQNEEYAAYEEESQHVPVVVEQNQRQKRAKEDVEFINEEAKNLYLEGNIQKHGGNYRRAGKEYRGKRERNPEAVFLYNPENGKYYKKNAKPEAEFAEFDKFF